MSRFPSHRVGFPADLRGRMGRGTGEDGGSRRCISYWVQGTNNGGWPIRDPPPAAASRPQTVSVCSKDHLPLAVESIYIHHVISVFLNLTTKYISIDGLPYKHSVHSSRCVESGLMVDLPCLTLTNCCPTYLCGVQPTPSI